MRGRSRDVEYVEFFAARGAALCRTAYGLCGDWAAAEELVQAAFVKLYVHWGRVEPAAAEAYTRRIVVNLFLNGKRRWREVSTDSPPEVAAAGVPSDVQTDERLDLVAALAKLPARQRAIVVLRFFDDLPVAEVAHQLDIAEGTVRSQTARALGTLRSVLEPVPNQEGVSHG